MTGAGVKDVTLYDSTLRDGAQTEGISYSVEDKVKIAHRLDEFGMDYIEGGWPAAGNRTDVEFFHRMREAPLRRARLVAFASTRRAKTSAAEDRHLRSVLEAGAPVVAVVGKSWDLHVVDVVRTTLEENLAMIEDTVRLCKERGLEVIFDAEHFFDGVRDNPDYAMATLIAAQRAGADLVCLCDTNGASLPHQVAEVVSLARGAVGVPLGIHAHNDGDLAVANSLAAVQAGAVQVQGTVNGYGERCGNANLCSVIPNLQMKLGKRCLPDEALGRLYELSHYVAEVANQAPQERQPFVGRSAFAHKGGYHVDAVMKRPETYEHIPPERVGNQRRLLVSDQAGAGTVVLKAKGMEIDLTKDDPKTTEFIRRLKEMEHEGYQFEGAEATFELLMKKTMGLYQSLFDFQGFRVIVERRPGGEITSEATVMVTVDGEKEHTAAEGDGPVHALDGALRKALEQFYPEIAQVKLTDFKVRVIEGKAGTAAKVRVLVETSDKTDSWSTVGVHTNIIEASWQALVDGLEYGLAKMGARPRLPKRRARKADRE
jgi:2-isopropylmalate synthase